MKCDFKKSSDPAMSRSIMIYRAICHLNLCGHFFKPLSISSTKSLVGYYWAVVHSIETQASALSFSLGNIKGSFHIALCSISVDQDHMMMKQVDIRHEGKIKMEENRK